ncbi:MAG: pantetheine-phosphate adenylyltransferase [Propionibacteriaceae bacterium]|jgi:pantetheine-phosphate adenylyltransferase|nr:pantetheine-phosphate adenylyltransferase [Propionibacteriaceae bacterium]
MKAVLAGSFDPFTLGHLDLAIRTLGFCDQVVVACAVNTSKSGLIDPDLRQSMISQSLHEAGLTGASCALVDGLLVDFCRRESINLIVRGARFASDFEQEWAMAAINATLAPIETVILPASATVGFISSTMVRSVWLAGGPIDGLVPPAVARAMANLPGKDTTWPR